MGNIQDAAECYDKAIEADPKNAASYFNKGVLLDTLNLLGSLLNQIVP